MPKFNMKKHVSDNHYEFADSVITYDLHAQPEKFAAMRFSKFLDYRKNLLEHSEFTANSPHPELVEG
jgi:hypothetical protein